LNHLLRALQALEPGQLVALQKNK